MKKPVLMAHRGYRAIAPENTMPAFEAALSSGADGIELDVHLSKDGEVIILHDESLDRTTDGSGFVRDYTLEELKRFSASGHASGTPAEIPTLFEYLSWAKGKPLFTNIELKTNTWYYKDLEKKTIALIRQFGMEEQVIFSCFNHPGLCLAKSLIPQVGCGALCVAPIGNVGTYVRSMGLDFLHPEYHHLTKEMVEDCHREGIKVNVWGVNLEEEFLGAVDMGVDGIITDEVERGIRLLG